jgi:putative ABC transport system permease protein
MYRIALKMLVEDRAKFIGMVLSLSFSALIITQQAGIFIGIMMRTYGQITDTPQAEIWVMDPNVRYIDDIQSLRDTDLYRVRCIDGVAWAVPYFRGMIRGRLSNGQFQTCIVTGVDDSTLIGAPHTMLEGSPTDLRFPDAIIVNKVGAEGKLAREQGQGLPSIPLRVGDELELNDRRAVVVGICDVTRTFQSQPLIYMTYNRALTYSPLQRKMLSFILVTSDGSISPKDLCTKIRQQTGFAAYTKEQFQQLTVDYYLKYTGIPINFGLAVLLGLLIGAAIAGQIFYNFVSDNLKYLALFSVMGASRALLAKMTILQAAWVAFLGWGIGSGAAALIGFATQKTELSFNLPWELFLGTAVVMFVICMMAALISITKIYSIELGTLFKG